MSSKRPNKTQAIQNGNLQAGHEALPEETSENLQKTLKEISDYKYALNESSIVAITDQKGIINHVNDNFCKISKYSREELLGQDHRIINSGYHSEEFIRDLWVTIAHGKIWKGELKNQAKDGTYYWVDTTIVPFLDQNKKPYQYIAIRADITGRKKLEEERALFASIVNYSEDAIFSITLGGVITSWNHGAEKIFGYTAAEVITQHITMLVPTYYWCEEYEITEKLRKGKATEHYETQRIRKDGTLIHVSLTVSPLKDSYGNITGASKIIRDITKQKKAEEESFKALKENEMVLNRISDGVVSVDNDWRYTFLNDAALSTHPLGKDETIGKVIWDVHPEMKGTIFWDKYHEAMQTRKVTEMEDYYAPMDTWFSVKVYPAADGLTIFYKNITESKKSEQELIKTLKEVSDYKFALDESSIVAITDQKGIIRHANDNFCKISRYSREELIGQDHRIINSGYHAKEFIKNLWATIANGKIWKGELKNKAKDGTIYWVDTTIVPFLNEENKPYQYVAIRADITERKLVEENLKQSLKETADYKYALDESSIIAITDQKGIIQYANENFCKISRYSRQELIGQDHRIINSGYHSKDFIKNLWVTIASGKIWKGELKNKAKDGSYYWVDTSIVPFLNEQGKPYQYIAIRADITERKRVEELLLNHNNLIFESEEKEKRAAELIIANRELAFQNEEKEKRADKLLIANKELLFQNDENAKRAAELSEMLERVSILATIAENIQDPVISSDNNFCTTSWNDAAEKLFEWKRDEVIGKPIRDVLKIIYPDNSREQILQSFLEKGHWQGEVIYHTKSGRPLNMLVTASQLKDIGGNVTGTLVLARDITERIKAEEKLKEFQYFFNNSNDLSCIANKDGYFEITNPSFETVLGYFKNELSQNPFLDFVHPDDIPATLEAYEQLKAGATVIHFINRYRKKNGNYLLFDWNATPNPLTGKLYCIARDITERKKAEDVLRKLNEELEAFSYSISHDLRAPLRGIIGFTNILEEDYSSKLDDEAKRITSIIKNNTTKMGALIDDLLRFSRLGRQQIAKTTVHTNKMIEEIITEMDFKCSSEHTSWLIAPLPDVQADTNTIRQVWVNLISNAVKYSNKQKSPAIEIGTLPAENETVFFVKDNGVGFDVKYKDKLFKVFQRLHSAAEFEGTGVGLAIVEKIITKHGGRVWAKAEPGEGACFYFSLPHE